VTPRELRQLLAQFGSADIQRQVANIENQVNTRGFDSLHEIVAEHLPSLEGSVSPLDACPTCGEIFEPIGPNLEELLQRPSLAHVANFFLHKERCPFCSSEIP